MNAAPRSCNPLADDHAIVDPARLAGAGREAFPAARAAAELRALALQEQIATRIGVEVFGGHRRTCGAGEHQRETQRCGCTSRMSPSCAVLAARMPSRV